MNLKVIGISAVAVVGLAAVGWTQLGDSMRPVKRSEASASSHAPGQAGAELQAPDSDMAAGSSRQPLSAPRHPFPEVPLTRAGMDLEDDPGFAESVAEQQWLDLHGYPNIRQWETYTAAPDERLREAAAAGDAVAGVMLDGRLLRTDPKAQERLVEAGVDGNLFALQLLAAYQAGSRNGDPVAAYAVSRVSEMRGDLRAAIGREVMMPAPLTPEQRLLGEAEALRLNETMNKLYFDKYGAPAEFIPRPIGHS
ncbi:MULTISPECIES: hypothetical protein [unclassified Stenotrophomonas]|uniref:hypothetical protein n=1 Tax=unclassified Stenotrophomonas TaxID=196198 RepID=UPI002117C7EC|nr:MULTISPECIES: hypothetical protein [unclassified Stenotrophomonas]